MWEKTLKPSTALEFNHIAVREVTSRFHAANPRIFGSVRHGTDRDGSDLDLLVDALPGATLFDLGGLQVELEDLLGVCVDLQTPGDLPPKFRDMVLAEATPVSARTACPITSNISDKLTQNANGRAHVLAATLPGSMPAVTHCSAAELENLIEAANKVCAVQSRTGIVETKGALGIRRECLSQLGILARPERFELPTPWFVGREARQGLLFIKDLRHLPVC